MTKVCAMGILFNMTRAIWTILFLTGAIQIQFVTSAYVAAYDLMKCSYGERGSLTATCVNATSTFFRNTPYVFDQLDETVRCVNCSLITIDSGTFDISKNKIQNLDLSRSQIEFMKQKAFLGLIFLENLYLGHNKIGSIYPGTFTGIKNIKYIDLTYNQINILSDGGFLELINLENLNLGNNIIKTIAPNAFKGLVKLEQLNLEHNQISILEDVFSNVTTFGKLQVLNLEYNRIETLKGTEFSNLTALLELNLANNKLRDPVFEFTSSVLRKMFLQNNMIGQMTPKFLNSLQDLETLDLSYNQLKEIGQSTLHGLYALRIFNLAYNKLTTFQTGAYTGLPQLEQINCSHNSIGNIEITGVFSLHGLHSLDLSYNIISDLDYIGLISRLPRLSYLELQNNILPCDLEDEMQSYFSEDNFKFVLYDNTLGAQKCIDVPVKSFRSSIPDQLVKETERAKSGRSGAEITIIVLITIIFICIAFLFYVQFRTYQQFAMYSTLFKYSKPSEAMSTVNLMATDLSPQDDDYRVV